ncbi:integrase family protein [Opitutaceae bacterium TAV1]|nr:integrase family protein [Opitutaceae bacterium TAV1]
MTSSNLTTSPSPVVTAPAPAAPAAAEKSRGGRSVTPTAPVVVAALVSLVREAPELCHEEISARLEREYGVRLPKAAMARLLQRHGLRIEGVPGGSGRLAEMEAALLEGREVSKGYLVRLLATNPALKERERETGGPGERVCVAHVPVMKAGMRSRVWVHAHVAVDTYGGMAVAELYREATTDAAVDFLHERVLPFYRGEGVTLACVETSRSHVYSGDRREHFSGVYPQCLRVLGIRHEVRGRAEATMNGYMEKFGKALTGGFVEPLRQRRGRQARGYGLSLPAEALARLRGELAEWLRHYNEEMPQEDYRNAGLTPRAFWQKAGKHSPLDAGILR